jgi:hypothetical protein
MYIFIIQKGLLEVQSEGCDNVQHIKTFVVVMVEIVISVGYNKSSNQKQTCTPIWIVLKEANVSLRVYCFIQCCTIIFYYQSKYT